MSNYSAEISWERGEQAFTDRRYSREHRWKFDGGIEVAASSSPHVVPLPMSAEEAIDPEEALVAALASCHMLSFLFIAAKRGLVVDRYEDAAEGTLAKNEEGRWAMTKVVLRPTVTFAGEEPNQAVLDDLHHQAHDECFIANSVRTEVVVETVFPVAPDRSA